MRILSLESVKEHLKKWNREKGFIAEEKPAEKNEEKQSWWTERISKPLAASP